MLSLAAIGKIEDRSNAKLKDRLISSFPILGEQNDPGGWAVSGTTLIPTCLSLIPLRCEGFPSEEFEQTPEVELLPPAQAGSSAQNKKARPETHLIRTAIHTGSRILQSISRVCSRGWKTRFRCRHARTPSWTKDTSARDSRAPRNASVMETWISPLLHYSLIDGNQYARHQTETC